MRRPLYLLLWLCVTGPCLPVQAQRKGTAPAIVFTQPSKRYISNTAADSLLKAATARVFATYRLPPAVLQERYLGLRSTLTNVSKPIATRAFMNIEMAGGYRLREATPGSEDFERIRQQYYEALGNAVADAFANNKLLQRSLYFYETDRISFFNSVVKVQPNGKLLVTETITVYNSTRNRDTDAALKAAGEGNNEIKRGIVRAFPTAYMDGLKLYHNTTFVLKKVERLGEPDEAWQLKKHENGYLLYIGREYYQLPGGYYTYRIVYETDNQLKLLPQYDELAWNVTGNGWNFRIDSAACTLVLPAGAKYLSNRCYTGKQADTLQLCNIAAGNDSVIVFKTRTPLLPKEGLSISTSWNKGLVQRAGWSTRMWRFIRNNLAAFLLPFLALLFGIYNFIAWWRVGRDPDRGVVFPLFYPPAGYSPAAMGYIYRQKFDGQLTSATVIDLAVKNVFRIDVDQEGWLMKKNVYHIKGSGKKPEPSTYHDFRGDADGLVDTTVKKGHYNEDLGSLHKKIQSYCESNYKTTGKKKGFFTLNNQYMAPGNLLTFLGCLFIIAYVIPTTPGKSGWQIAWMVPGLVLCIAVQTIFYKLISTYTATGRKAMDDIEGFRMYLVAADEQRINAMNPPAKTPELYEKYMPFAVALDCEIEWGKQFEDILETAVVAPGSGSSSIHNSNSSFHSSSFSSSFAGSFSGAISSATSPPSSGGGGSSFGGGSSGGGGGGGGGGGW